eukprot:4724872-Amphidinium_carterae.1
MTDHRSQCSPLAYTPQCVPSLAPADRPTPISPQTPSRPQLPVHLIPPLLLPPLRCPALATRTT